MLETISDLAREFSTLISILAALIGVAGLALYIRSATKQFKIWSRERDIPDVTAWRYPNLYEEARHYGPQATAYYLRTIQRIDLFFPIAIAVFFWLAFGFFTLTDQSLPRNLPALALIPLAVDYAENLAIRWVLKTSDRPVPGLATLVRLLVAAKFLTYAAMTALTAALIFRWVG